MTRSLDITVIGTPGSKGDKRAGTRKDGTTYVRETGANHLPWRTDVVNAATAAMHDKGIKPPGFTQGPVEVIALFYHRRNTGHFSQRQDAGPGELKDSAPAWPAVQPDVDKWLRATLDALQLAGVLRNDGQVVRSYAEKRYADGRSPGALIRVRSLLDGKEPSQREDAP